MTTEEKRERNRLYQRRFYAKAHGGIVPPLPSTLTEVEEDDAQYVAAVRQHLADVAAGNIPPADRLSPHREPVLRVSRE